MLIMLMARFWQSEILCIDVRPCSDSDVDMIRPYFLSASERLELEACVRSQREDHGIARRANATLLLVMGSPVRS